MTLHPENNFSVLNIDTRKEIACNVVKCIYLFSVFSVQVQVQLLETIRSSMLFNSICIL